MKVYLDSNVLISAVVQQHESHSRSLSVLARVQGEQDEGFVSGHSVAEIYAVLTKLPPPLRHSPEQALLSIEENIIKYFTLIALTGADYSGLVREMALAGVRGGTIYDAVHLKCALKSGGRENFYPQLEALLKSRAPKHRSENSHSVNSLLLYRRSGRFTTKSSYAG